MKEALRCLHETENAKSAIALFEGETAEIQSNARCLLYYAYALVREGRLREAEEILCGKDGKTFLVVPDIRECELTLTDLWVCLQQCKGTSGEAVGDPPHALDFRMFAAKDD